MRSSIIYHYKSLIPYGIIKPVTQSPYDGKMHHIGERGKEVVMFVIYVVMISKKISPKKAADLNNP